MMPPRDRIDLLGRLPKQAIAAEVGVHAGLFADKILSITDPRKLYLIDCWQPVPDTFYANKDLASVFELVVKKYSNDPRVIIVKDFSLEAAKRFQPRTFDWVYIDANHEEQHAFADLCAYWPLVKANGFLAGHDYLNQGKFFGAKDAVDKFVLKNKLSITMLTSGAYPSYAIRKPLRLL